MFPFRKSTDKRSVFKADLKKAIREGDTAGLTLLLEGMGDLPKPLLLQALNNTLANRQIGLVTLLLKHGANPNALDTTLRDIVYQRDFQLFKLFIDHGADFEAQTAKAPRDNNYSRWYQANLQALNKELECEHLREEIEALKKELTEIKAKPNTPESPPKSDPVKEIPLKLAR